MRERKKEKNRIERLRHIESKKEENNNYEKIAPLFYMSLPLSLFLPFFLFPFSLPKRKIVLNIGPEETNKKLNEKKELSVLIRDVRIRLFLVDQRQRETN
jgi:hypothetical protein